MAREVCQDIYNPFKPFKKSSLISLKIILFAHAVSGCDITSALYRKGKVQSLRVLQKEGMEDIVSVFDDPNNTRENINAAATKYILRLYGAKSTEKSLKITATRVLWQVQRKILFISHLGHPLLRH